MRVAQQYSPRGSPQLSNDMAVSRPDANAVRNSTLRCSNGACTRLKNRRPDPFAIPLIEGACEPTRCCEVKYRRPDPFAISCLLGAGSLNDTSYGRQKYQNYLQWLAVDETKQKEILFDKLSKGWVVGTREFKGQLLKDQKQMAAALKLGSGSAKEARELVWAKRWNACMSILGKRKRDIAKDPKSAPWKAAIACHLKTRQLCRNGWIAEALQMGSESGVS